MAERRKVKPVISDLRNAQAVHAGAERLYVTTDGSTQPITYEQLALIIKRLDPGTIFVLDSSFVSRHEIDSAVWEALFEKKVVISPLIWPEFEIWLNNPFSNKSAAASFLAALGSRSSNLLFDHESPWPEEYLLARKYYVTLLSDRKQRSRQIVAAFEKEHNRSPSPSEMNSLWQKAGTSRDFHLLRKGFSDLHKPNYFADEDAIVTAAMISFFGGNNTVILTRDGDLLEQFSKLTVLLTQHYQALVFADQYASDPQSFENKPMPLGIPEIDAFLVADQCQLIKKPVSNLDTFTASILPSSYEPVSITCVLLGGNPPDMTRSFIRFNGERDLDRLFQVKGLTRGLSTDKLNGKNCHVTGFPKGIEDPRSWVIVGEDVFTEVGIDPPMRISNLDRAHANYHFEVKTRMKTKTDKTAE